MFHLLLERGFFHVSVHLALNSDEIYIGKSIFNIYFWIMPLEFGRDKQS